MSNVFSVFNLFKFVHVSCKWHRLCCKTPIVRGRMSDLKISQSSDRCDMFLTLDVLSSPQEWERGQKMVPGEAGTEVRLGIVVPLGKALWLAIDALCNPGPCIQFFQCCLQSEEDSYQLHIASQRFIVSLIVRIHIHIIHPYSSIFIHIYPCLSMFVHVCPYLYIHIYLSLSIRISESPNVCRCLSMAAGFRLLQGVGQILRASIWASQSEGHGPSHGMFPGGTPK